MVKPTNLAQSLNACPAEEFFGRHGELDAVTRLARDAARGANRLLAVSGPAGSGKSALLRRAAVVLFERGAEITPLLIDLASLPDRRLTIDDYGLTIPNPQSAIRNPQSAIPGTWIDLCRAVLRQVFALIEHVEPDHAVWFSADAGQLAGMCHGAGLNDAAALCRPGLSLTLETWRALLRALIAHGLAKPLIFIDGASQGRPADAARLALLAEGCRAEGCAALYETPHGGDWAPVRAPEQVDRLELAPLSNNEALAVAQSIGRRRQWALSESALRPIVGRLGPWPGWVRGWATMIQPAPPRGNPIRCAEEAYVDWLTRSPWAGAMARAFERVVEPVTRERALRLVEAAAARPDALDLEEAAALAGVAPRDVEELLGGLLSLGLIEPRGVRWAGPRWPALVDWMRLTLAASGAPHSLEAARLDLLTRRLTEPRPALDEPAAESDAAALAPWLLARFRGQILPQVLFQYGDFYEALGRLTPARRREMILTATSTVTVPEAVGVVPWEVPARTAIGAPSIHYARAYRDGRYQRSHEETWIVFDWSDVRALTTPEIGQGLELSRRLEARLGPGRYVRWLIIGESASPEAIEFIRRERLFCSNREQLLLMREWLTPAPAPSGAMRGVAKVGDAPGEMDRPGRAVIDLSAVSEAPQAESSRLSLPARPDSEIIAALMAEKIAIRAGFDLPAVGQIKTAVLEGSLNAIEHSPNSEKLIAIAFELTAEKMTIAIENDGPAFDPLAVPVPHAPAKVTAARKRGWGITLMQRFMDEVGYEPSRRGTRLTLVKRRAGKQPESQKLEDQQV
jgi:anti-sigma regulatory factor (Ser/Thr protein kinase)